MMMTMMMTMMPKIPPPGYSKKEEEGLLENMVPPPRAHLNKTKFLKAEAKGEAGPPRRRRAIPHLREAPARPRRAIQAEQGSNYRNMAVQGVRGPDPALRLKDHYKTMVVYGVRGAGPGHRACPPCVF